MKRPIRLGFMGWGHHAQRSHADVIGEEFRVTAIFDPAIGSKDTLMLSELGIVSCESAQELARRPDVDAVVIASPDEYHAGQLDIAVRGPKARAVREAAGGDGERFGERQRLARSCRKRGRSRGELSSATRQPLP